MSGFTEKVMTLTRKDLRAEARGLDTLPPMLVFALTVVVLLAFAVPGDAAGGDGGVPVPRVIATFFWMTVLFAGLIGFARTFEAEREEDALASMLLAPLDRTGHFVAKTLTNLLSVVLVEVLVLGAIAVLFEVNLGFHWSTLLIVVLLADVGFVTTGTLFAAVAAHTRSRELMLPILALPALVPVMLAAFELTADAFERGTIDMVAGRGWFGILVAFDVIVGIASALAFEFVVDA